MEFPKKEQHMGKDLKMYKKNLKGHVTKLSSLNIYFKNESGFPKRCKICEKI